jgi:Holliday junction DNA helicase RuvA
VGGVGYELFVPLSTTATLKQGDAVALHVHTLVREDALQLYGFATPHERELFLLFTSVTGIGPKVALALLSAMPLAELVAAIGREDIGALSRVSGVGKKTASRLALELREKVAGVPVPRAPGQVMVAAAAGRSMGTTAEAVSALVNLGYNKARAESAVQFAVAQEGADVPVEVLIRSGLTALSQNP